MNTWNTDQPGSKPGGTFPNRGTTPGAEDGSPEGGAVDVSIPQKHSVDDAPNVGGNKSSPEADV